MWSLRGGRVSKDLESIGIHPRLRLRQTCHSGNVPCLGVLPTACSSSKLRRHVILFDGRVLLITL
jgi:hypothetical protein